MSRYTFLVASARPDGNSEQLARLAAGSLPESCKQLWLNLRDLPLEPFQDLRHQGEYQMPAGNALRLLGATMECDNLVFVTPVYWYSVPAPLKLYLDHWSHWMRVTDTGFKAAMRGKNLRAISASAGPAEEAEHMFAALELSAKYMGMNWCGHVLGNGSAAGDVQNDNAAVEKAKTFFSRPD